MAYDKKRDPNPQRMSGFSASTHGPARNWYALTADHIGAKELPRYARCIGLRLAPAFSGALTLVVVPISEKDDASTRTLIFDSTNIYTYSVRRIVTVNGGTTIPANVSLDLITD